MDGLPEPGHLLGSAPADPARLALRLANLATGLTGLSARVEFFDVQGRVRWAASSAAPGDPGPSDEGAAEADGCVWLWEADGARRARLQLLGPTAPQVASELDWRSPGLASWLEAMAQGLRAIEFDDRSWQASELDDVGSLVHGMALSQAAEADIAALLADRLLVAMRASVAIVGVYPDDGDSGGTAPAFGEWASAGGIRPAPMVQLADAIKLAQMTASGTAVHGHGPLPAANLAGTGRGPWLLAPLQSMGGSLGVVLVGRGAGAVDFTHLEAERLLTAGSRAAFALRFLRERESEEDAVVAHERHRIARDLHDLTIQRMFGVGMFLETSLRAGDGAAVAADRVAAAIESINDGIAELRLVIAGYDGDPPPADAEAVAAAVGREVALQRGRFPVVPTLEVELPPALSLSRASLRALTAAVREGLSNAGRHCDCQQVSVRVTADGDTLRLELDSRGRVREQDADARPAGSGGRGRGISNLQRRAQRLGGDCLLTLEPDGAELSWWVPVGPTPPAAPAG